MTTDVLLCRRSPDPLLCWSWSAYRDFEVPTADADSTLLHEDIDKTHVYLGFVVLYLL